MDDAAAAAAAAASGIDPNNKNVVHGAEVVTFHKPVGRRVQ
jgi:hypothetical protein